MRRRASDSSTLRQQMAKDVTLRKTVAITEEKLSAMPQALSAISYDTKALLGNLVTSASCFVPAVR